MASASAAIDDCCAEHEQSTPHLQLDRQSSTSSSSSSTSASSPTRRTPLLPSTAITKAHWKDEASVENCEGCGSELKGWLFRDNCRRCGGVFCRPCVSYRRKLSLQATPDPVDGFFFRVCKRCFGNPDVCEPGLTRSHTKWFHQHRNQLKKGKEQQVRQACTKLTASFGSQNSLARVLSPLSLGLPEWSKVNFQPSAVVKQTSQCPVCTQSFGLFRSKKHCHLCGHVFCESCLLSSLQVYLDESKRCIIEPVNEDEAPPGAQFLMVCAVCLAALRRAIATHWRRQSAQSLDDQRLPGTLRVGAEVNPGFGELGDIYQSLSFIRAKVEKSLPKFERVVDTMHARAEPSSGRGHVQTLAKHQADLSDLFTNYTMCLRRVKGVIRKCTLETETKVITNMVIACTTFYREHLWRYRALKKELEECVPDDVLAMIQQTIDLQMLRNVFVVINQLAIESMAFEQLQPFAIALIDCAGVISTEAQKIAEEATDDPWDEAILLKMVKEGGRDRPMITRYAALGAIGTQKAIKHCDNVLRMVLRHMEAKGSLLVTQKPAQSMREAWRKLTSQS